MKVTKPRILFFLPLFFFFLFSCGEEEVKDEDNDAVYVEDASDGEDIIEDEGGEKNIICIWKAVSLKETPSSKGKYITTIYLGEAATTFGEIITDSSGWIQENLMAIDAEPYVIKSKTKLYKRPDILTAGNKEFERMQFVVVTETQSDWAKVKGKRTDAGWFSEGWVKISNLTNSDIDVAVAILAERAMVTDDKNKKIDALNEIVENSDFSVSQFISDIQDVIDDLSMEDVEPDSGIEEEEGDY